ncbi:MAG TPA: metallopeptidase TldD-related protein [Acidimicrobiales bacterium]|jgi:predicted Zn-dependent protease
MIPAPDVIEEALRAASRHPKCAAAIVLVEELSQAEVRYALNTTTTNGVRRDRTVTVIAITAENSVGTARQSGTPDPADLVKAALADAEGSPPAEDAMALLTPSDLAATHTGPIGIPFDTPPASVDLSALDTVLAGLAPAFTRARNRPHPVNLAGFAEYGITTVYLGTSTGLRLAHAQPTGAVQLSALTATAASAPASSAPASAPASAWIGTPDVHADFAPLEDEIWRRLEWAAKTSPLPAGRYDVVMPPSAVTDMMACLHFFGLSGRDAEDGRSVFSAPSPGTTRLGELLSTTPFTLYSDPYEPGVECLPFNAVGSSSSDVSVFDDGLPLGRTDWIHDGHLAALQYHRAGAAHSNLKPSPYIDNLILRADPAPAPASPAPTSTSTSTSTDDLVAEVEHGLLLTCLWYIREVDPTTFLMTGLTRDGVYVIEDGKVVGATNNFRFNESPLDLLARASRVGTPVRSLAREWGEYLNRTVMPPLRIPDFNMSSVSQAS